MESILAVSRGLNIKGTLRSSIEFLTSKSNGDVVQGSQKDFRKKAQTLSNFRGLEATALGPGHCPWLNPGGTQVALRLKGTPVGI